MTMRFAITRAVSPDLGQCELTYLPRQEINVQLARQQHDRYERALEALGCQVRRLPEESKLPDAVFVEDTALVVDELAVITRPGAASRRPETTAIAAVLSEYRELAFIEAPGTLDGGDLLAIGKTIYVGVSQRSNRHGVQQLADILTPHGFRVEPVEVGECLHLKSAATLVQADTLLINPNLVERQPFGRLKFIEVDPGEPAAANALLIGETILVPDSFDRTRSRLEAAGITLRTVDVSELQKAEGAVTCCSLIFSA